MAIPKHIIDLTALALQDRVLTFNERQTIVVEAEKAGVAAEEINRYIDTALAQRLQSYTKEELKRCPTCGAQIPLISDECFYCGSALEKDGSRQVIKVSGEAAEIIQQENQQTAEEQQNIQQCPDCGAPFPLVSHICTHCGHVLHAQQGAEQNIKTLLDNIKSSILALETAPKPGFFKIFIFNIEIVMIAIALIMVLGFNEKYEFIALTGDNMIYAIVLAVLSMYITLFTNRDWNVTSEDVNKHNASPWKASPVEIADRAYYDALEQYKTHTSQANTLYGKSDEAKKALEPFADIIRSTKIKRTVNRAVIAILYIALIASSVIIKNHLL